MASAGKASYDELWRWSVSDLEGFWGSSVEFYGLRWRAAFECVLPRPNHAGRKVVSRLEAQLRRAHARRRRRRRPDRGGGALAGAPPPVELTFGELREQVARARAGLQRLGVGPGDRVAAYLPNIPETLIAFIATVSLGAIWATCAPSSAPAA